MIDMHTDKDDAKMAEPLQRQRVMIVEDEGMTVLFLQRAFRTRGFDVVGIATNGQEAISRAREAKPDFILMDINMPIMDGIEATRHIMAERPLPIIMLTAYNDERYIQRAQEAGACGYLIKPLELAGIIPAIEKAFRCFEGYQLNGRIELALAI